jgi:hypothetical protein
MPKIFGPKALMLWKGDIVCKVKEGTNVVCWKDKWQVYLLTNMNNLPASRHFVDEEGNSSKPVCIKDGFCRFE